MGKSRLEELAQSSQNALLWAGALALHRAEQKGVSFESASVDVFDLFIGLMLEQPKGSEAKALLDHFHLAAGQILPPGYVIPTKEDLERHLKQVSLERMPLLATDVELVIDAGASLASFDTRSEQVELPALFGGFFTGKPNPLSQALEKVLGTTISTLGSINEEYLANADKDLSYSELLKERFAYSLAPVAIPNYKSDHGRRGDSDDDLLDIKAEVDAFAYLLASLGLKPPIAVGLFGDWGSGKSFFMESVHKRIEQLTQDPEIRQKPQSKVPFWKRIVQIRFNAWHYVEGDLWASLVDHIFNELRLGEESESLVEKRRRFWQQQLATTKEKLQQLKAEKNSKSAALSSTKKKAGALKNERDRALATLEGLRAKKINDVVLKSSINEVRQSISDVLTIDQQKGTLSPDNVEKTLREARAELQKGAALWRALWRDDKQVSATIGMLLLTPVVVGIMEWIPAAGETTTVFAGISTATATMMALLGKATVWVRGKLDAVSQAEVAVQEEVDKTVSDWQKQIQTCEQAIQKQEKQLAELDAASQQIEKDIETIQVQLDSVTPASVLNEFVAERVGSSDYRKWLGLPAMIQRDFDQLSSLVEGHNTHYFKNDSGGTTDENYFNRIILYIDDLDRCSDEQVVKVLQAVHLLLAFELFVVVVAVDARWLNYALIKHFPALVKNTRAARNGDTGQATADDYLEKIFQIPFWIQALGDGAKKNMVRGLLHGHILHEAGDEPAAADTQGPTIGDGQLKVLASLDPAAAPPILQTENFSLSREEFDFLEELSPILGETPRSVKRFANLYQLVRIIYRSREEADGQVPSGEKLVAFLLALGDGLPVIGEQLMKSIRNANTVNAAAEFKSVMADLSSASHTDKHRRLQEWLQTHEEWNKVKVSRMAQLLPLVERFLFRVGEQLLSFPESSSSSGKAEPTSRPKPAVEA